MNGRKNTAPSAPNPEPGPPSRGIGAALWSLATPDQFLSMTPTHRAVPYRAQTGRGVAPLADVYLPEGCREPIPSVVITHGGGFLIGSRGMKPVRFLATRLVEAGYGVMCFDYRMVFRGGRLNEAVDDTRAAIAWWRQGAPEYGIDPNQVSALGLSAGAALTLLAVNRGPREAIQRVISAYGVYDFSHLSGRGPTWLRQRLLRSKDTLEWTRRSPIVDGLTPQPTLLLHGTADRLVPLTHAERLLERRAELGYPTEHRFFAGQPHGFLNDARSEATAMAVKTLLEFLAAPAV